MKKKKKSSSTKKTPLPLINILSCFSFTLIILVAIFKNYGVDFSSKIYGLTSENNFKLNPPSIPSEPLLPIGTTCINENYSVAGIDIGDSPGAIINNNRISNIRPVNKRDYSGIKKVDGIIVNKSPNAIVENNVINRVGPQE